MSKKERGERHEPHGKAGKSSKRWRLRPGQQALKTEISNPTNRQERRIKAAQVKNKLRGDK